MQIVSPMSGTLITFSVAIGTSVAAGDEVALIESMKMEIPVTAEVSGTIASFHVAPGDFVEEGDPLATLN